jgi:hypothetical protein
MNRILSILLSVADELIPYFRPSNRKGFVSALLIIGANSIPVFGVIYAGWNPFMLLFIYWGESLIVGFFNLLRMLISGTIQDRKFSPSGFAGGVGLSLLSDTTRSQIYSQDIKQFEEIICKIIFSFDILCELKVPRDNSRNCNIFIQ